MIEQLKAYFEKRQDVAMAFIFGSFVKESMREESDVDVAVYFFPEIASRLVVSEANLIEIEEDVRYEAEDEVRGDVEKRCVMVGKERLMEDKIRRWYENS